MKPIIIDNAVMMVPKETDIDNTSTPGIYTSHQIGPVPSRTKTFFSRSGRCLGLVADNRELLLLRNGSPNVFSRKK